MTETKSPSQLVDALGGPFGTEYELRGGRRIRVEIQGTSPLIGLSGGVGTYEVFSLYQDGSVMPAIGLSARHTQLRIGGLIAPFVPFLSDGTLKTEIEAPFHSQFGCLWRLHFEERTASANQSYVFFRVYREPL